MRRFLAAQLFPRGSLTNEQESRAQISRCASGAGGRTCHSEAARMGWRVVLAKRAPPLRAARSGADGCVGTG